MPVDLATGDVLGEPVWLHLPDHEPAAARVVVPSGDVVILVAYHERTSDS